MSPRINFIIPGAILTFCALLLLASFAQNVQFFRAELKIAFPQTPPPTFENVDRAQISRISRAINISDMSTLQDQSSIPPESVSQGSNPTGAVERITSTTTR